MPHPLKTNVYIDGFNFYYGSVKDTPYKWLDLAALLRNLLPSHLHTINKIRYFTAAVQPRSRDPQQPQRQQTFLRALGTIPNLTIHYGDFYTNTKRLPLAHPPSSGPRTVEVVVTEEKGSDVNLATFLIVDGILFDYDAAVVVSNDSDLALPLDFVRNGLKRVVGILNPHPQRRSRELFPLANFYKPIRTSVLAASQFPHTLQDAREPLQSLRPGDLATRPRASRPRRARVGVGAISSPSTIPAATRGPR